MEAGIGKENSLFKSFAGGGIGGMFFLVVGHPFDTMKVSVILNTTTSMNFTF